jgi:protein-S-isoprenylcysteine O-methyltransferase Ste14
VHSPKAIPCSLELSLPADAHPSTQRELARGGADFVRYLDWFERLLVLALYAWLVGRILTHYWTAGGLANLLLLPSEGLVVLFVLIRRSAHEVSRSAAEWLIAFAVTCLGLLAMPAQGTSLVPQAVGGLLLLMGMVIQVHAKITVGRSFGCVPAHRGLRLTGPYQLVRHPMYSGYLLSHVAFLAMNATLWNGAIYLACYALQVPRMFAEERLLGRDPDYRAYTAQVRYRLIPGIF